MDLHGLLPQLASLFQVLVVDVALAGDNAVVVGLAVAGLPTARRRAAIVFGIAAATVIRVALGAITLKLLAIVGLLLAGGLLLLYVCWRMYRELRRSRHGRAAAPAKSLRAAIVQIVLADLSMSLDNVLAVAGASNGHVWVLVAGITLSVILMGVAANLIANLLERHRWIAWVGLAIVLYIALKLIWEGGTDVIARGHLDSYIPRWFSGI